MKVGCYTLDLYCDTGHRVDRTYEEYMIAHEWNYTGRTEAECIRNAKAGGWRFARDGKVYCPHCTRAKDKAGQLGSTKPGNGTEGKEAPAK